jgi:hypothetical protein
MRPRLAGSFGAFGVVAGLAAAALFMPDGCKITDEASLRLRVGLPLVTPLLFLLLAPLLARVRARVAVPLVLLGCSVYACAIGLLYDGPKGVEAAPFAALSVWPILASALIALPLAVRWGRRATDAPPDSPPARADRAVASSFALAAASVAAAGALWAGRVPLDGRLAWAACAGAGLCAAACGLKLAETVRSLRLLAAIAAVPSEETGAPLPESLRRVRQDRRIAGLALLLALAGCAGAALAIAEAPPWVPPKHESISFSFGPHC